MYGFLETKYGDGWAFFKEYEFPRNYKFFGYLRSVANPNGLMKETCESTDFHFIYNLGTFAGWLNYEQLEKLRDEYRKKDKELKTDKVLTRPVLYKELASLFSEIISDIICLDEGREKTSRLILCLDP